MNAHYGILALLVAALVATPCYAQGTQEKENARTFMDLGDERYDEGNYKAALKAYKAADEIMNVPTTGVGVAKTLLALGLLLEANERYYKVFNRPVKPGESKWLSEARKEARIKAEELYFLIPSIEIKITGLDESVVPTVTIDGKALKASAIGLPSKVNPGKHTIVVSAPGYKTVSKEVELKKSEKKNLSVSLVIDPDYVAASPLNTVPKPPPLKGGNKVKEGGISPFAYAGFSLAGIGVVIGAITGGLSLAKSGDIADTFNCKDNGECNPIGPNGEVLDDEISSATELANLANGSIAMTGSGIIIGIVGLAIGDSPAMVEAGDVSLRPTIGPGTIGVSGTF